MQGSHNLACLNVHSGVIIHVFQLLGKHSGAALCFLIFPDRLKSLPVSVAEVISPLLCCLAGPHSVHQSPPHMLRESDLCALSLLMEVTGDWDTQRSLIPYSLIGLRYDLV